MYKQHTETVQKERVAQVMQTTVSKAFELCVCETPKTSRLLKLCLRPVKRPGGHAYFLHRKNSNVDNGWFKETCKKAKLELGLARLRA